MFLPFFGLFYVLKTASFQRFLDITGGCGHLRSFAVTLRSRVTATRKFEIVGKWRFLCYEHVTRVLIRVKGVCFCVFSTPCQRYLCRVREVSHSETSIPSYWVFSLHGRGWSSCTDIMDWQSRNESWGRSHGRVPGRTSMIYVRCGLSCPRLPFRSLPHFRERIGLP